MLFNDDQRILFSLLLPKIGNDSEKLQTAQNAYNSVFKKASENKHSDIDLKILSYLKEL